MLMPAIASAGIATAVIGATMPGWDGSTWWGVIGDPIGTSAPHVPFMVSLAPLIVVVVNAVVPLRAPSMRPWFGPAVATSSLLMLGQIFAWMMLYRSLTDARPPSGGSLVMLVGLVLALGASLADWGSWQRYLGARRSPSARRWPAVVALGGIALTALGAGLPLWSRSNPWGPPRPPIPSGVNPGREPGAAVTWWEVLGPDPRNLVMEAELAVALIPAAIAVPRRGVAHHPTLAPVARPGRLSGHDDVVRLARRVVGHLRGSRGLGGLAGGVRSHVPRPGSGYGRSPRRRVGTALGG